MKSIDIYTVTELNHTIRNLLEEQFFSILVEGEISNFVCPASGHWYFTLKDDQAQIRCAMFRTSQRLVRCKIGNGLHVQVRAKVSLYAPRGDYQLIVEHIEEAGFGKLQQAFEALKQKLAKEGLFATEHKKTLPPSLQTIGIITSSTGAAIRDILTVLQRRAPQLSIIIYPTLVQGSTAANNIATMITIADQRQECDVLIVGRGGGSLEDLWPFNEEIVARAIYACSIPIISAVGHEIDVTIADFVADVRAPTPSAAAEIVSAEASTVITRLAQLEQRFNRTVLQILQTKRQTLHWLQKRLRHPRQKLQEQIQRLDYTWQNLLKSMRHLLDKQHLQLSNLSRALNAISPLATLDRGYAILQKNNHVVRSVQQVKSGDKINVSLSDGTIDCRVI